MIIDIKNGKNMIIEKIIEFGTNITYSWLIYNLEMFIVVIILSLFMVFLYLTIPIAIISLILSIVFTIIRFRNVSRWLFKLTLILVILHVVTLVIIKFIENIRM